jgi:hypothetical protein
VNTATKPLPPHGTLSRCKYHGCKCGPCRKASAAYQRSRYRKRGYGTWQPFVDAEPVRQHLAMLRQHNISYIRAAELAGLYPATVGRIIYSFGNGKPPRARVRVETAQALFAIQPADGTPNRIDATGTIRRLQALGAIGWPFRTLGPHIGVNPSTPGRLLAQDTLYATTANAVTDAYERLSRLNPEDHGVPPIAAIKARLRAQRNNWRDPQFWEDNGRIDDPDFDPDAKTPRIEQIAQDAWWLLRAGEHRNVIAARLGISRDYVDRALREVPEEEVAA